VVIGIPKDNLVFEGICYGLIGDICASQGIANSLSCFTRWEVFAVDELILSPATKQVLAMMQLDHIAR
jgi:D-alanine transaminase